MSSDALVTYLPAKLRIRGEFESLRARFVRGAQAHNLKIIGSNPIPAASQQVLEIVWFQWLFAVATLLKFCPWKRGGSSRK